MRPASEIEGLVADRIRDSVAVKQALLRNGGALASIVDVARAITTSIRGGGKILFFGNGGSAADAQHLAAELTGRFLRERPGLPGLALTTNTSCLTAIGNDYGYDLVFARQLQAMGAAGDVALAISTSGNSASVLRAVEVAKEKNDYSRYDRIAWGKAQTARRLLSVCELGPPCSNSRGTYSTRPYPVRDRRRRSI